MRQASSRLNVDSRGRGLIDLTDRIRGWVGSQGMFEGVLTVFVRHTSASLLIQENADPAVQSDLERFIARLVPDGDPLFHHTTEGPDDMPAHVRAALTAVSLSIPISRGFLVLGTWQAIYLYEHRTLPQRREIVLHLMGE